jgi:magnesium chelatase family protein
LARYRQRVSGPLLDRIDLVVKVGRVDASEVAGPPGENSSVIRRRVEQAAEFKRDRPSETEPRARQMVLDALDSAVVTARGADRVTSVARTIADLALMTKVSEDHVAEAMALRGEW